MGCRVLDDPGFTESEWFWSQGKNQGKKTHLIPYFFHKL